MKKYILILLLPLLLLASFSLSFFSDLENPSFAIIPQGLTVTREWTDRNDPVRRLRVVKRVLAYVEDRYVDPKRIKPGEMFKEALERVSDVVPEVRVAYPDPRKLLLFVGKQRKEFSTNLRTLYSVHSSLLSSLQFVKSNLISDIPSKDLEVASIEGLLTTLDPHSVYLSPRVFKETKQETRGKFGGLGILIGIRDTKLTVISPLEGTPAFRAGIKASDVIVKIDGESTINMTLTEAVNRMRGRKGVPITISVSREGWNEPRDFTIVRDIIKIVSIESSHLGEGIAYVQIRAFHGNTIRDLTEHLNRVREKSGQELKGLVLDLRNNPGGLLDQAIAVSDKFLTGGPIVSTVIAGFRARNQENATRLGTEPLYPIAILTNSGSASASEIVAGAIQSRGRGVVIGRQTFGKGSVQSIFDLPNEAGLKLTIRQYLTPGDRSIQNVGISPDIRIYPAVVSEELLDIHENPKHIGEDKLEGHLLNPHSARKIKTAEESDRLSLPYFEGRTAKEIRKLREDSFSKTGDDAKREQYLSDFSVSLAKQILLSTQGSNRLEVLKAAKTVVPERQAESMEKIQEALAKNGIDWSDHQENSKSAKKCPAPKVSFEAKSKKGKKIRAGEEVQLTVKVSNPGPCDLSRFWAQSKSDNFLFANREFLVGKVKAGQSVSRSVEIKLPKRLPSELLRLNLEFDEAQGIVPETKSAYLTVHSSKTPRFAFDYSLREKNSRGVPNGLIQPGERIQLRMQIKNVGEVSAKKATTSIKNLSGKGITLIMGRKELSEIAPGKSDHVEFEFVVSKNFREPEFKLNFAVFDAETNAFTQRKMNFKVYAVDSTVSVERKYRTKSETKVFPLPNTDLPPIGRVSSSTTLSINGTLGSFVRIPLRENQFGWISLDNLDASEATSAKILNLNRSNFQPPRFSIDTSGLIERPMKDRFAKIKGKIQDTDGIKDFYIRVNDRKVFYQNYRVNGNPTLKNFETLVPLENGRNEIRFIAQDEEGLLAQESIVLHREGKKKPDPKNLKVQLN